MKKDILLFIAIILVVAITIFIFATKSNSESIDLSKMNQSEKINWFKSASDIEKKEVLTPQQYHTIVDDQMEATFLGALTYNKRKGNYYSVICEYHVFSSEDKFKGSTGYLEFEHINLSNVQFKEDYRSEQIRVYSICGEHLGYVEDNQALDSGKQFIINSESLEFRR